jgi:chromosome partitioning protein
MTTKGTHDTMAHVIALANHKGGASKTTSVANLGAALAGRPLSKRVLLIDADPQANLSTLFGCDPELLGMRLEDALEQPASETPPAAWRTRPVPDGEPQPLAGGVHLLPCTEDLELVVREHGDRDDFPHRLADLVAHYRPDYDYILIDTPPGRQALATLALLAAEFVIAPVRPADLDVEGAIRLTEMLEDEIARYNPQIKMLGVLVTQAQRTWKLAADTRLALAEANIGKLRREIPFAVRVGHAPRHRAPTIVLEPDGRVGSAYRDVAIDLDHAITATAPDPAVAS